MSTELRLLLLPLLLASGVAGAEEVLPPEAQAARDKLVLQANQAVSELLRLHCPERCQLIDVRAEVDLGQPLAHVQPGFEELSPAVREVRVRGVDVQLLVDARLPAEFRRDFVGLVKARLKAMPVTTSVRAEAVPFPQPVPVPAPPALQSERPAPQAPPPPPPEPEKEPLPEPFDPTESLLKRLIEASPWLLGILLVLLGALAIVRALRPVEELEEAPPAEPSPAPPRVKNELPVDTLVRRVRSELADNPRLASGVLRQLLLSEREEKLAALVRLVGPGAFEPLREDPACRPVLLRVGQNLRGGLPQLDEEHSRALIEELEGRLLAARLEGMTATGEEAFAFLDRLSVAEFRRLLGAAGVRAQGVALRFAPAHLRAAALETLEPALRRQLFLSASETGSIEGPELSELADELRLLASRTVPGGDESGLELLTDLLDSQGEAEQAALLDALASRPSVRAALLARQISESTLLQVDDDALVAVAAEVQLEALSEFLRGSPRELQARFTAALSGATATALKEELSLSMPFSAARFSQARRQVLSAARRVFEDRGVSVAELNVSGARRASA